MRLHNFWWLLYWPILCGAFSLFFNVQREEFAEGKRVLRWKPLAAVVLAFPFVIWAGWRQWFGDTEMYRTTFRSMPSSAGEILPYMRTVQKGPGFRLIELVFKCFISRSDIAFFVFVAAFQMICLVYMYRRYSSNFWLSFFLFIASTDYLSWMHNGIRQFISAVLLFLCVPFIVKDKYIPAIVLVLVAAYIHSSALVFLPFVFVINGRAWNVRTLLFMLGMILAVIYAGRITGILTEAMVDTAYEGDIVFLTSGSDNGTNIWRVLFYSVPALMSFVFRSYIDRANDPLMNVCVNLSVVTAGFYVFSYFTSGILMGALPIYFSLSNYILIPRILEEVFNDDSALILEMVFLVVYTAFFYYQCGPAWGLL